MSHFKHSLAFPRAVWTLCRMFQLVHLEFLPPSVSCDVVEVPTLSARLATCTAPPTSASPPSRRQRPPRPSWLLQPTAMPASRKRRCEKAHVFLEILWMYGTPGGESSLDEDKKLQWEAFPTVAPPFWTPFLHRQPGNQNKKCLLELKENRKGLH